MYMPPEIDKNNKLKDFFGTLKKNLKENLKTVLIVSLSVLVAALGVAGYFLFFSEPGESDIDRIFLTGRFLKGISVEGVDISGMTKQEAETALAKKAEAEVGGKKLSLLVNGEIKEFEAEYLGVRADLDEVLESAMMFGQSGDFAKRTEEISIAESTGKDFELNPILEYDEALHRLRIYSALINAEPTDATFTFKPEGVAVAGALSDTEDDEEDDKEDDEAENGLTPEEAEIVGNPNIYHNTGLNKKRLEYIPEGSKIARFAYTEEVVGVVVDYETLAQDMVDAVAAGSFGPVEAKAEVTQPEVTLEDVKRLTTKITSYTSWFNTGHLDARGRVHNIVKLSGIINGVIIQPGETWSVNEEAGRRTISRGWAMAPGIRNGAYVDEPGGGVCQVSSTIYNAMIRAEMEIVNFSHHSYRSGYIPIGLDATISTGGPDLKIKNPYDTPIYIVSFADEQEKCVTVEIYGAPLSHGHIVDFTSKQTGTVGAGEPQKIYNVQQTPDGKPITEGESRTYISEHIGRKCVVYKHYLDSAGNVLTTENFDSHYYRPQHAVIYVNGSDPTITPTPTPAPSTSTSTTATPTPSTSTSTSTPST